MQSKQSEAMKGTMKMNQKSIERINELTKLSRERQLTPEETSEREALRKEYLQAIRRNFKATLDSIELK